MMYTSDCQYVRNPVRPQDMVEHAVGRFQGTGHVIPPAQRHIYQGIARETGHKSILEAGCGIGVGTHILRGQPFLYKDAEVVHRIVIGTDLSPQHIEFARQLYPFAPFDIWDITQGPYPAKLYDFVVAVEAIEHVEDPKIALRNLVLSCREGVWMSTPNRNSPEISDEGPKNPHHVQEFTPSEIIQMAVPLVSGIKIRHWDNLELLSEDTEVTPLVYELIL